MSVPLNKLLALPLPERVVAVAEDVQTKKDAFRQIPAHDLAQALGVPQPECPTNDWFFSRYLTRQSVEKHAENCGSSDTIDLLYGKVAEGRYDLLSAKSAEQDEADCPKFDFLTAQERELIEDAIWEQQRESGEGDVFAFYSVDVSPDESLGFEAFIEDDGSCIDLKTPYDLRDSPSRDPSGIVDDW